MKEQSEFERAIARVGTDRLSTLAGSQCYFGGRREAQGCAAAHRNLTRASEPLTVEDLHKWAVEQALRHASAAAVHSSSVTANLAHACEITEWAVLVALIAEAM